MHLHILHTARVSVCAYGFSDTRMKDIARSADVAIGTLYKHFPSKAALFSEVFRQISKFELKETRKTVDGDGTVAERLEKSLRGWCHRAIEWHQLAYALLAEPVDAAVAEERLEFRGAYTRLFAELIEAGVVAGEFPPQIAKKSATYLVQMMAMNTVWPLIQDTMKESEKIDVMIRNILAFCVGEILQQVPSLTPVARRANPQSSL